MQLADDSVDAANVDKQAALTASAHDHSFDMDQGQFHIALLGILMP